MIECKFHHEAGVKTNVKTALYVYARFLDIKDSLILRVIGWDFSSSFALRTLVEKSNLHPLTCLSSLSDQEKQRFLAEGIVFCPSKENRPG